MIWWINRVRNVRNGQRAWATVYYLRICNYIKKSRNGQWDCCLLSSYMQQDKKCKKWTERMDKCLLSSYKQNEKINYGIHVSKNM
jgi:hypothetical protein